MEALLGAYEAMSDETIGHQMIDHRPKLHGVLRGRVRSVAQREAPPPRTGEVSRREPSHAALLCVSLAEGAILRTLHSLFKEPD